MANNFDFLKTTDKDLFEDIQDAQKLFRDEYFNQAMVQLRVYAEKMAKKILNSPENLTFDDTLNCLKDKIKSEREKEFIEDLFFIKREGNKCAHGEDVSMSVVLEAIQRAFEATINYVYAKNKDDSVNKLVFDETLLVTGKPMKENKLVAEYVKRAELAKEELLNQKQGEFSAQVQKTTDDEGKFKDESYVANPKQYKENKTKKPKNPKKEKIKNQIKEAKKNLRENINIDKKSVKSQKNVKKQTKAVKKEKTPKTQQTQDENRIFKFVVFMLFVTISLFFLTKMLFFF